MFKEIVRVTDKYIIVKDHIRSNFLSYLKLKFMDDVGNGYIGVNCPYNYLTKKQWEQLFKENNLKVVRCKTKLHLYKGLFHKIFDSDLHFIVLLEK